MTTSLEWSKIAQLTLDEAIGVVKNHRDWRNPLGIEGSADVYNDIIELLEDLRARHVLLKVALSLEERMTRLESMLDSLRMN